MYSARVIFSHHCLYADFIAMCSNQSGFVIDKVPLGGYTWCLLDRHGDVLARAPRAYDTEQEAQIAIAEMKIGAREGEVPTADKQTIADDA